MRGLQFLQASLERLFFLNLSLNLTYRLTYLATKPALLALNFVTHSLKGSVLDLIQKDYQLNEE
jgi:hypothetical protein